MLDLSATTNFGLKTGIVDKRIITQIFFENPTGHLPDKLNYQLGNGGNFGGNSEGF